MEVSALKISGGIGLHGRSRLLRLQSDERLVGLLRRGNTAAFEVLLSRYESRLQAFCRHLLGSREDAEDVMQEVMAAAFNAMLADDRPINVRPWLYRIARNRSLNHLRRIQSIGVDTMDVHLSEHGASVADKAEEREEFRLLVGDIHELPETQKTALVLREMDALSYEQIAEAMETTVPSVKSLLVRARVSLAEAAEARLLSCDEVRIELAEVSEGLRRRPSPLVRRHLRQCKRCTVFRAQLKSTNKALAALLPIGPTLALKQLLIAHLGHSAASSSGATAAGSGAGAAGAGAAGAGAAGAGVGGGLSGAGAAATAFAGSSAVTGGGFVSAGIGAVAAKAAAGLAAAALVTSAAVVVNHSASTTRHANHLAVAQAPQSAGGFGTAAAAPAPSPLATHLERRSTVRSRPAVAKTAVAPRKIVKPVSTPVKVAALNPAPAKVTATPVTPVNAKAPPAGRTQNQSDPTVLPPSATPNPTSSSGSSAAGGGLTGGSGSGAPGNGTTPGAATPTTGPTTSSPTGTAAPTGSGPTGGGTSTGGGGSTGGTGGGSTGGTGGGSTGGTGTTPAPTNPSPGSSAGPGDDAPTPVTHTGPSGGRLGLAPRQSNSLRRELRWIERRPSARTARRPARSEW